MALTDTQIRKAKTLDRDYQLADGDGLSLLVRKKGTKSWRYEFRLADKKHKYLYGNYPEITLENVRKIHSIARELVQFGKNPATLLDDATIKKMIIDGASLREIEAESLRQQTAAALTNIPTFGELAEIYWQEVKRV
ncbi:MAG: Arm DNA-binding domain-containing protein [Methylococcaceae bacterium]|nr:Arm DNA-binding domain-containing protein [Methylococcaceae bacterium]